MNQVYHKTCDFQLRETEARLMRPETKSSKKDGFVEQAGCVNL